MTGHFRVLTTPAFERDFRKISQGDAALVRVLEELLAILREDPHNRFLSKESVNVVGAGGRFESVDSLQRFMGDLRRYCWESSKIIDSFAEEWYSKYKWQQKLDLPHVATFVWAALKKIRNRNRPGA